MAKSRILIIEDDIFLLEKWKKILEEEGYEVDVAENGKKALALWNQQVYDLLLVDLRMPEVDGMEVIDVVKNQAPLTQVIIISGQGQDSDLIEAINRHVFKYLPKPADLDDILQTIQDALAKRDPVLQALEEMTEQYPDKPILLVGREKYTPHRLYDEVRKMTPLGREFHENFMKSMIDLNMPVDDKSEDELLGITSVVE